MIPESAMAVLSVGQISMVGYIIEFLIGVGTVYLAVLGAVKVWDVVSTTVSAVRADWKESRARDISMLGLWKERIVNVRKRIPQE